MVPPRPPPVSAGIGPAASPERTLPSPLTRGAGAAIIAGFAVFTLLGYAFGKWYMHLGWDLGWRTSQFFFNYQDLGFVKRALVGSLLHPFPTLLRADVFLALCAVFAATFVWTFGTLFIRAAAGFTGRSRWMLAALCASSPAVFLRQGFDLGRFDVLGLLAVLIAIAAIDQGRWWLAGLASAVALLAHEAYVVINLPLIAAYAWTCGRPEARRLHALGWLLGPPAVVTIILARYGLYEPGLEALTRYFAGDARYLAAKGGAVDVDAIAVLTRGIADNIDFVSRMFWEKKAWLHLPFILGWGALMAWFFRRFYRDNQLRPGVLFYAAFTPLLLSAIASDYYRWVALTVTNFFLVILLEAMRLARRGIAPVLPAGALARVILASAVLGPISNTKSFPLLFVILEQLLPGKFSW